MEASAPNAITACQATALPEELLLHIFLYLDADAPSTGKNRHEPSLGLTSSPNVDLKNISLVSKQWRRIVLQSIFKYARMRLDATPRPRWEDCRGCLRYASVHWATSRDVATAPADIASYHESEFVGGTVASDRWNANDKLGTSSNLTWESRLFHRSHELLQFFQQNHLTMDSFVLYTTASDRYKASAVFWQRLLSIMKPRRIVVMAPPAEMAYLTSTSIDLSEEWAFDDMNLHILELEDGWNGGNVRLAGDTHCITSSLRHTPRGPEDIAEASLLRLRPWEHLGLNEGSFLGAYARYEYFERGPPSIIPSIKNCVTLTPHNSEAVQPPGNQLFFQHLRSFTYTAILPFAAHMCFRGLYPQLETLDVQLAPHPEETNILNDKRRIGKTTMDDCWQEFRAGYRLMTRGLASHDIDRPGGAKNLKKFICRDKQYAGSVELREELDEEFMLLCMPVWAEMEEGVFVRLADRVEYATDVEEAWL